ncbi:hypothetical protein SNE40_003885 [Patella caerulea]|uniref:Diphthamide biosynthesis protein 4 n=1 Tax=Patella caerulea TaxID=87958 RepID=A0AAN8KAR8_PATCE
MDNFYSVLDCGDFSGIDELRRSYIKLVKKYHPDKAVPSENTPQYSLPDATGDRHTSPSNSNDTFIKIDKAWKILSDTELRKRYDIVLKQRLLSQDWPIQDEVMIGDFEVDDDDDDDHLLHQCRCGGYYVLSKDDMKFELDFVCCDSCTLCVKILYEEELDNPD